jgi:hypothetical protein
MGIGVDRERTRAHRARLWATSTMLGSVHGLGQLVPLFSHELQHDAPAYLLSNRAPQLCRRLGSLICCNRSRGRPSNCGAVAACRPRPNACAPGSRRADHCRCLPWAYPITGPGSGRQRLTLHCALRRCAYGRRARLQWRRRASDGEPVAGAHRPGIARCRRGARRLGRCRLLLLLLLGLEWRHGGRARGNCCDRCRRCCSCRPEGGRAGPAPGHDRRSAPRRWPRRRRRRLRRAAVELQAPNGRNQGLLQRRGGSRLGRGGLFFGGAARGRGCWRRQRAGRPCTTRMAVRRPQHGGGQPDAERIGTRLHRWQRQDRARVRALVGVLGPRKTVDRRKRRRWCLACC